MSCANHHADPIARGVAQRKSQRGGERSSRILARVLNQHDPGLGVCECRSKQQKERHCETSAEHKLKHQERLMTCAIQHEASAAGNRTNRDFPQLAFAAGE
jgi:hypothetical protein